MAVPLSSTRAKRHPATPSLFLSLVKTIIALAIAIGLTSGAFAAPKAPETRGNVASPTYTAPDYPMRTRDDYGKRWALNAHAKQSRRRSAKNSRLGS